MRHSSVHERGLLFDRVSSRSFSSRRSGLGRLIFLCLFLSAPLAGDPAGPGWFSERAGAVGLEFTHYNGMSGKFYLLEIMGSGVALFDYDRDGDLDAYLVQGRWPGPGKPPADPGVPAPGDRLYRNDLMVRGNGGRTLRFTDVTEASGIGATRYGMGVTSGDFDNDGWVDLYVTNYGKNQLLRNKGDGTFEDVTDKAAVSGDRWSVSAAFFDYDRDGWLDLYVGNYVEIDLEEHKPCLSPSSSLDYCTPLSYGAQRDRLYRNRGDGRFEDVSVAAGIGTEKAPALGVVVADYNRDGWPDIYVANDATPNHMWFNQQNGTFVNEAFFAGTAVNMAGAPEASMGVAAGDFDNDGDEDLFMTHLTGETNTLYVNDGKGWFEDRSIGAGLGGPSKAYTGFGAVWLDVDNDGWLDIFTANGEVNMLRAISNPADPFPLHQTNQLFINRKADGFEEVTAQGGSVFTLSEVSRGVASGDVDNDGDMDILLSNNRGPARLLINSVGNRAPWLGLRLIDGSGRDALGAQVEVRRGKGVPLWGRVHTDGSYASAVDPRVLFGLGEDPDVRELRVHWPAGGTEVWTQVALNRYTTLREGSGRAVTNVAR